MRRRWLPVTFAVLALAWRGVATADAVPHVAAASDLQFALAGIAADFTRISGRDVRITFGSSGNFRRQIADGAPFELFLSADASYVDALAAEQRTLDAGVVYAIGRLALLTPRGGGMERVTSLDELARAVADGRVRKFAIANPEHAPYGRAARQALARAGLWDAIAPHVVLGENVSQAATFALSGAAQGGIVALSLARAPPLANRGVFTPLPLTMHEPLIQKMVLLKGSGATAHAFYDFLQGAAARAMLAGHGFDLPPGDPASAGVSR
jgi:molybdate transport system substrate-binding protein